ncbi:hypothetical protein [Nonomuraea sp. NPDC049646]|uniref:hypothetical protein n=1 Tax=Nonomuraea sp. NPDC049646 TaxID=3364354 RepID=UPI00379EE0A3
MARRPNGVSAVGTLPSPGANGFMPGTGRAFSYVHRARPAGSTSTVSLRMHGGAPVITISPAFT